jgi:hypothetical protein
MDSHLFHAERFLFVFGACVGFALCWISYRLNPETGRGARQRSLYLKGLGIFTIGVLALWVLTHLGGDSEALLEDDVRWWPDTSPLIAFALGALSGAFTETAVSGLPRHNPRQQKPAHGAEELTDDQDEKLPGDADSAAIFSQISDRPVRSLLAGATLLALVIIVYSLPLYQREASTLLSSLGLSTLKLSVADLTVEADLTKSAKHGVDSASNMPTGSAAQTVARPKDPVPGLALLAADLGAEPLAERDVTLAIQTDGKSSPHVLGMQQIGATVSKSLARARDLVQTLPINQQFDADMVLDSAMPELKRLLALHEMAVSAMNNVAREGHLVGPQCYGDTCDAVSNLLQYPQPYVSIALADLMLATGAPDAAAAVLADWLTSWDKLAKANSNAEKFSQPLNLPEIYHMRVLERLRVILGGIDGGNSRGYLNVLQAYKTSLHAVYHTHSLDSFAAGCSSWNSADPKREHLFNLIDAEKDYIRTELAFLNEKDFADLDSLRQHAEALASTHSSCLPQSKDPNNIFSVDTYPVAFIGEGQIIAGAAGEGIADRMFAIADSSSDTDIAKQTRDEAAKWLTEGWAAVKPVWQSDVRNAADADHWSDRIFTASRWENAANLAMQVHARLSNGH